jgi:hypothetical protein
MKVISTVRIQRPLRRLVARNLIKPRHDDFDKGNGRFDRQHVPRSMNDDEPPSEYGSRQITTERLRSSWLGDGRNFRGETPTLIVRINSLQDTLKFPTKSAVSWA